ncbi:hypothetical protein BV898_08128 [Hypsibius exemplaris]|uniref:Uncharacterized protein n=1 Tax=Hypsibius exemplaris TaxID=2072580 RepID=A0A1W0WRK6_HYPEX|nr:hypothetical protein BV898_08128 [Hypsibius exemplaris]
MQRSSSSPAAAALRKPWNYQSPSGSLKKSPTAVVRRTSSGGNLHDQLRKSPTASSPQLLNGGVRQRFHAASSSGAVTGDDAIPRSTATATLSPASLKIKPMTPFVPDLSLVLDDSALMAVSQSPSRPAPALPPPRIQHQETEIVGLRTQLQYYVQLNEQLMARPATVAQSIHETSDGSTQTENTPPKSTSDSSTMTAAELLLTASGNGEPKNNQTPMPPETKPTDNRPVIHDKRIVNFDVPLASGSSDISIACNNLAQKYLFAEISPPPPRLVQPPRPKLISSNEQSNNFYTVQDGEVSIATQHYLERHRLMGHPGGGRGHGRPLYHRESIIEVYDEDNEENEPSRQYSPNGFAAVGPKPHNICLNHEANRRPPPIQPILVRPTPKLLPSPKECANRPRLVDNLDLEQLKNLPKLPSKKSVSPFS